jgi:integrase
MNFSRTVMKRTWNGKAGRFWYGREQAAADKPWRWVKLFTDKRESLREWERRRVAAERLATGATTAEAERLRTVPLADLLADYHRQLERNGRTAGHVAKSRDVWRRILKLCGWRAWSDITPTNVAALLDKMDAAGATASYKNKVLQRVKAFVNAVLPDETANPLRRVRYVSEKGAKRTRERRAASVEQLHALLALDLPDYRRLAWALAAFNGLRRNEAAALTWSDVHMTPAGGGFFSLRQKAGSRRDHVPIHPYVRGLLDDVPAADRDGAVLLHVPRVETLRMAWKRAGVPFVDDQGRRLDYHALRHTFQTMLDLTGCSRATKKRLMRHATGDVTDGYAHAELTEMAAALAKLPAPPLPPSSPSVGGTQAGQQRSPHRPASSPTDTGDIVVNPFPVPELVSHRPASDAETEHLPNHGDWASIMGTLTVTQYTVVGNYAVNREISTAAGHTRDGGQSDTVPHGRLSAYRWPGSAVVRPTTATALEGQITTLLAAVRPAHPARNAPADRGRPC